MHMFVTHFLTSFDTEDIQNSQMFDINVEYWTIDMVLLFVIFNLLEIMSR